MTRGWFVGDFEPAALRSTAAEVGVKRFAAGEREDAHLHRVATEVTLVVDGAVLLAGEELGAGDIVVIDPGEVAAFEALSAATLVVAKLPSVPDDKELA